jgi:hypothetical protein
MFFSTISQRGGRAGGRAKKKNKKSGKIGKGELNNFVLKSFWKKKKKEN